MAWDIEVVDDCAVVRMNTDKVNVQNDQFFADLHGAFDIRHTGKQTCASSSIQGLPWPQ